MWLIRRLDPKLKIFWLPKGYHWLVSCKKIELIGLEAYGMEAVSPTQLHMSVNLGSEAGGLKLAMATLQVWINIMDPQKWTA